jgi:hypothetical protein
MPSNPAEIAVSELRTAVARMLDAVEAEHGSSVDLDADLYWWLDPVEMFDMTADPQIEVGQISEDVEDTRGVLTREEGEIWLWHDLAHLAAIFLRLAALDTPRQPRRA